MQNGQSLQREILTLIEKNAKLTAKEIAVYLGAEESAVSAEIAALEKARVICGYGTLINWELTDDESLTALIEVKVTPARGKGFSSIAERIYSFDEVKSVYLMSGGYDLAVIIEGKSLKDISMFVSDKLSPLESVLSTATHFVLKKYKDHGVVFGGREQGDERMIVSP
ncbi:MAG: Lrp/AsnC family transcriptional regulator [Oscillospiraceae bacterium]|jgi:DNA-binding Lrp family transcriptional regulator|nr:Lrp/AsnC family transcriptional regulator [Oscillospiraceae bacterium]